MAFSLEEGTDRLTQVGSATQANKTSACSEYSFASSVRPQAGTWCRAGVGVLVALSVASCALYVFSAGAPVCSGSQSGSDVIHARHMAEVVDPCLEEVLFMDEINSELGWEHMAPIRKNRKVTYEEVDESWVLLGSMALEENDLYSVKMWAATVLGRDEFKGAMAKLFPVELQGMGSRACIVGAAQNAVRMFEGTGTVKDFVKLEDIIREHKVRSLYPYNKAWVAALESDPDVFFRDSLTFTILHALHNMMFRTRARLVFTACLISKAFDSSEWQLTLASL